MAVSSGGSPAHVIVEMPRPPSVFVLLLAVLSLFVARPASADQVELSTGERISGRLVSLAWGTLTFSTAYGDLYIPWEMVSGLDVESPILVTVGGARPEPAQRASGTAAAGLTLDPGGLVAFPAITAIARPQPPIALHGTASAGFVRSGGNSDVNSLRLDSDVSIRARSNRYSATGMIVRSSDRGVETARNWSASLKYDRFVSPRFFINANAILTNDEFRDLALRSALGAGFGYQVIDDSRVKLMADAGIGWVYENLRQQPGDRYTAARESASLDVFLVLPDRLRVFHKHDGYFGVTGEDNMFIRTQNGIAIGIAGGFVTTTRLDVDYDRVPAPGRRNVDRTVAVTLGYQF